ncbi:MAG: TATA-box-binding protein [Halobacteriales archaeon]
MTTLRNPIRVENIVATAEVTRALDLEQLAFDLPRTDYHRDRFPGLVYRTTNTEASILLFRTGAIVITGTRSKAGTRGALTDLVTKLRSLGVEVPDDPTLTIQNMVSSVQFSERLNLNAVAIGLGLENIEYEPEQFPGLIYRFDEMDVVTLLFGSGKAVITGAVRRDEASEALAHVRSRLEDLGVV